MSIKFHRNCFLLTRLFTSLLTSPQCHPPTCPSNSLQERSSPRRKPDRTNPLINNSHARNWPRNYAQGFRDASAPRFPFYWNATRWIIRKGQHTGTRGISMRSSSCLWISARIMHLFCIHCIDKCQWTFDLPGCTINLIIVLPQFPPNIICTYPTNFYSWEELKLLVKPWKSWLLPGLGFQRIFWF